MAVVASVLESHMCCKRGNVFSHLKTALNITRPEDVLWGEGQEISENSFKRKKRKAKS